MFLTPDQILAVTVETAIAKVHKPLKSRLILGFIGGAMISLGYLAYLRVAASVPDLGNFLGACVFPIGLIVILMAGGELITGNMMVVATGYINKQVSLKQLAENWLVITLANVVGAIFVAYAFGILAGSLSSGIYLEEALHIADSKVQASALTAFVSGIGCNWFVGLAVWLSYGAKDTIGKLISIWFPVMIFVALGFQHSVANSFVVPFAIFEGHLNWLDFFSNFIPVYLGNVVGGVAMISLAYSLAYEKH